MSRLKILISNDDGFRAKGITLLAEAAMELGDVTVVAPDGGRSGASSAITSAVPITLKKREERPGYRLYSSSGMPADCMKLALSQLYQDSAPDLVLTGINHGRNDGVCVHYSGTIGGAIEANLSGIPALAVSLDDHGEDPDFSYSIPYAISIAKMIIEKGLPEHTFLSLNLPQGKPLGLRIVPQTNGRFVEEYIPYKSPSGSDYYWMSGHQVTKEPNVVGDVEELERGYATLTPIHSNMTNYAYMEQLREETDALIL